MQTGEARQLTHQREGILRSYVYFTSDAGGSRQVYRVAAKV